MIVQLRKIENHQCPNVCYLPIKIFSKLSMSNTTSYTLNLGQRYTKIFVKPSYKNSTKMYITEDVFQKLLLQDNITLNIWIKNRDIFLGPVIGVFVNNKYISSIEKNTPLKNCVLNLRASKYENCFLYFFSAKDIDFINQKNKGLFYDSIQDKWIPLWLPLSDIVYDRGVKFNKSLKDLVKHLRKQFQLHPRMNFINNKDYLSKWHLYKNIKKFENTLEYLPETVIYQNFDHLQALLKKYEFIFIKSFYGSKGREVMSIKKIDDKYHVETYLKGLSKNVLSDISELEIIVENFIKEKKFIIQQGINLFKYNDRKFDLRILLQKDLDGKWQVGYYKARLAKKGFDITNLSTGGENMNYEKIYQNDIFNSNSTLPAEETLISIAIELAINIEKIYGDFGELGMDIAIDSNGHIWFLEANTKPDKTPLNYHNDIVAYPQFLNIFKYSKFLVKRRDSFEQ